MIMLIFHQWFNYYQYSSSSKRRLIFNLMMFVSLILFQFSSFSILDIDITSLWFLTTFVIIIIHYDHLTVHFLLKMWFLLLATHICRWIRILNNCLFDFKKWVWYPPIPKLAKRKLLPDSSGRKWWFILRYHFLWT